MTTNLKRLTLSLLLAALLLAALLAGLHSPLARAAGISVNTASDSIADGDGCSLREAIINANNDNQSGSTDCASGFGADTITFDGNYTITLTDQLTVTTEITITGNGVTNTIVQASDCNPVTASCSHNYRVFEIASNGDLTLAGLTVRHGNLSDPGIYGGGISNAGGAVTLNNCTLSGNSAGYGGGIYNDGGTLAVSNSTLSGNSAVSGGGIVNLDGTLTISNSTLSGNSAGDIGGGIYNAGDAVTLNNSTLSGNSAGNSGGGIYNYYGLLAVSNSTLSGNSADVFFGGGIVNCEGGTVTVTNSTLSGNSAGPGSGGGIFNDGSLTVSNSTLSGNSALLYGGGIVNNGGTVTVGNSTLSGNSAVSGGGGIENYQGTLTVGNSTLTANRVETSGGGISSWGNDSTVTAITNTIVSGNIISGTVTFDDLALSSGDTDSFTSGGHNLIGVIGLNINAFQDGINGDQTAVNDPQLGPLTDNGGDTLTHALLLGSPAIDAGDNDACPATDQRGVVRPQGVGCDIGAVEAPVVYLPLIFNGGSPPAPDLVVDNLSATGSQVTVTLRNQGNAPVVDAFWVDVYLNPATAPSGVNQR